MTLVPAPVIVCVDCGGSAHLISRWDDEDPPRAGDLATYRCADCGDRWDLILEDDDLDEPGAEASDLG